MIGDWKNLPRLLASALYMPFPNYSPHNNWGNPSKKCCSLTMLLLHSKSSTTQGFCIVSTNKSEKSYEILFNSQIHTTLPFELSALSMLDISWLFQENSNLILFFTLATPSIFNCVFSNIFMACLLAYLDLFSKATFPEALSNHPLSSFLTLTPV